MCYFQLDKVGVVGLIQIKQKDIITFKQFPKPNHDQSPSQIILSNIQCSSCVPSEITVLYR